MIRGSRKSTVKGRQFGNGPSITFPSVSVDPINMSVHLKSFYTIASSKFTSLSLLDEGGYFLVQSPSMELRWSGPPSVKQSPFS